MIAALVLAACLVADPELPAGITLVDAPEDAVAAAVADMATLPLDRQADVRYVWIPPWASTDWHHAVAFAVNTAVSRSGSIRHPTLVAGDRLQRWDLVELVPDPQLRVAIAAIWDDVAGRDPYVGQAAIGTCRIMRADWCVRQMLSAIDGRYLELRGLVDLQDDDGRTPEQIALSRLGIFESTAIELDGDRRVGMIRSDVTGKARAVLALRGLVGSAWITEDLLDRDIDTERHPIYHLLDGKPRGHEIIAELPNGLHLFLVTDDSGQILREAPPDLVADHRVPAPHTKRLDAGPLSCVRCHAEGSGLRDCRNDVAAILSTDVRILADGDRTPQEAADEIATRYAGRDFERHLERGRLDYDYAIDELTGGKHDAESLSLVVAEVYGTSVYPEVDARRVCLELGFSLPEGVDPVPVLRELLPSPVPTPAAAVAEDPTIALLAAGVPIGRVDLDRLYPLLLARSAHWRR